MDKGPDSMKTAKYVLEVLAYFAVLFISISAIPSLLGVLLFDLLFGFNLITWLIVVPILLFFVAAFIAAWRNMPRIRRKP